jgi:transcriptional regulator with XRE-family HTH domain
MAAARKSAMLERIELAALSQTLDLRRIAAEEELDDGLGDVDMDQVQVDLAMLRKILADAGINTKKPGLRIGVSRDEIAKLETGGRKRPKITTLRKIITALNYARDQLGEPPLGVKHLQVPGEVLLPEPLGETEDEIPQWERDLLDEQVRQQALDAYQEASNDMYYASDERDQEAG